MVRQRKECKAHRELYPAIAAGAPVPLADRGEALHHTEQCLSCQRMLETLRQTWDALAPGAHPDPVPSELLDARIVRAIHGVRAAESSVTAIPIVLPREEEKPRRLPAAWSRILMGLVAAAAAATLLWFWAARVDVRVDSAVGPTSTYDHVSRLIEGADPSEATFLIEQELNLHPQDGLLWRLLGEQGAAGYDLKVMCRGFERYLELRPEAPDRGDIARTMEDRFNALGVDSCPPDP